MINFYFGAMLLLTAICICSNYSFLKWNSYFYVSFSPNQMLCEADEEVKAYEAEMLMMQKYRVYASPSQYPSFF